MGSLSLLQQIFLTQESNQGLLHCPAWGGLVVMTELGCGPSCSGLCTPSPRDNRVRGWALKAKLALSIRGPASFRWPVSPAWGFLGSTVGKESICQHKRYKTQGFDPWIRKIPWRRKWQPTLVFLPGKFRGQRSHGVAESDMTECARAHTHIYKT